MSKFAVRGGMSGAFRDGMVFGNDANSCLRRALLRHHGIEEKHSDKTKKVFKIGEINENRMVDILTAEGLQLFIEREILEPITDSTNFVGHADIVALDEHGSINYELKSVTSKNTYKKVFTESRPKLTNLLQCANYMISQETDRGRLCYTSYIAAVEYKDIEKYDENEIIGLIENAEKNNQIETKVFEISFDKVGRILVDGVDCGFSIEHIMAHREESAYVLENNIVFEGRPQSDVIGDDPCGFCPFRTVCDSITDIKNINTQDFLNKCKEKV